MKAAFEWYNDEQTIIIAHITGGWRFEDLYAIVGKAEEMIATVPKVVDVILDYTEARLPRGNLVSVVKNLVKVERPQLGIVVLAGMGAFINTILDAALKAFPRELSNFRVASSIEEALELIRSAQTERNS